MIEAKNLRKVYKTKKGVVVNALDDVSVKLPSTGMVFILGKSGSGKSTLLNVLGGLDSFDSGEIIIKGTSSKSFKQSHYDSYRNTYIGFIFQEYNVLEELTVGANVALAIELQGRKATNEEINSILKEVDLDGYGQRKPNELSGGQKQRVAIARALGKKPERIMADEPTCALDYATGKQVFDTLKKLSRDKLVLIVSHDREFSEQYADRIIELKDGVIISDVEKESTAYEADDVVEDDDSIVYGDGEISVKAGYALTEEDRLAINEYLAAAATGATIKLGGAKLKKKFSEKDFKPTDESKIVQAHDGKFQLIKSKLSIKNAFKLGSGGLKYKKFRLVFTILLSVIAFTLFGLADTIAAYDSIKTATNSIYDTGVTYASYVKSIKQGNEDWSYWRTDNTFLTPDDIELISTQTGRRVVGIYKGDSKLSYSGNLDDGTVEGKDIRIIYMDQFSGLAAIDQNMLSEHSFSLLAGRLPDAGKNEIVITKYAYDYFNKAGYKTYTEKGEEKLTIEKEADLIGKTLDLDLKYNDSTKFEIVGIVDTGFDYSRYEKLADENAQFTVNMIEMMALTAELESAQNYSFASVGFVNSKLISDMLAEREGQPERVTNGNVQLYVLADDSMITDNGEWVDIYGEEGKNVLSNNWYESVSSLEKVKDKVLWIGGTPLASLADNQIIVTVSQFQQMSAGGSSTPEIFWQEDKLIGFEKVMLDNLSDWQLNYHPSLSMIFDVPKYFTAVKFAYENPEAAKDAFRKAGWDEDKIGLELSNNQLYSRFANISEFGGSDEERAAVNELITAERVNTYIDEVIARYNLASYKSSDTLKTQLVTTYIAHDGKEYSSYDVNKLTFSYQISNNLSNIIASRYAAENYNDALNYYKAMNNITEEMQMMHIKPSEIVNQYSWYVMDSNPEKAPEGFVPAATVDFNTYKMDFVMAVYKSNPDTAKRVLSVDSNMTNSHRYIKDLEVVGVVPDMQTSGNVYMGGNYIVLSDALIDQLFGPNRGGIYTYAAGVMPSDKAGINDIVKFAKTYINDAGNAKYQLSNNVTSQLDMVDEILDMLGQIFLYVGIGFAVFASLMLTNFIGTSITHKKQEIGILRAIGSRSADVFRIFFAESFIIAMINYVLALSGTFAVTLVINNVLRESAGLLITFLAFGVRQIGILFAVSLGVAFIATFFPVKKIASMKPIDAIKNRK